MGTLPPPPFSFAKQGGDHVVQIRAGRTIRSGVTVLGCDLALRVAECPRTAPTASYRSRPPTNKTSAPRSPSPASEDVCAAASIILRLR